MSVETAIFSRRAFLRCSSTAAFALGSTWAVPASFASGRAPIDGRASFRLPWPVSGIDPHRLDDVTAAVLGEAIFDRLYTHSSSGAIIPALAASEPSVTTAGVQVELREGLKTARDRAILGRDVIHSIARARQLGARGWLADIPGPRLINPNLISFAMKDPARLMQKLASPLCAIVPTSFTADVPDGTGAYRAERRKDGWSLERNANAALGPAFLQQIIVTHAPDLSASLRAFEVGTDDLGWLGSGLHETRRGTGSYDGGILGWAILCTGKDAGTWDQPGIAQTLADSIPPARLSYLTLGAPWNASGAQGSRTTWSGPPAEILVRDDTPYLIELARAVAATLESPGHELQVRTLPTHDFLRSRATRSFTLAIDSVRALASRGGGSFEALAAAESNESANRAARPPLGANARVVTRTLRLGVLGELRMQGGRSADLNLLPSASGIGLDFAGATRTRRG